MLSWMYFLPYSRCVINLGLVHSGHHMLLRLSLLHFCDEHPFFLSKDFFLPPEITSIINVYHTTKYRRILYIVATFRNS